jgi:hypothetical protein
MQAWYRAFAWYSTGLVSTFEDSADTLQCLDAFSDETLPAQLQAQAQWLISVNLPDDETYLLDLYDTPKKIWDKRQSDYAGKSYVRKAELYQRLAALQPNHEKLSEYLQRACILRTEMQSAGIADEVLLSAFFLLSLRRTDTFRDWAIQQLQKEPPAILPELVSNLRTAFRDQLDEHVVSPEPSAHLADRAGTCAYCHKPNHHILACRKLRADQESFAARRFTSGRSDYGRFRGNGRGGHGRGGNSRGGSSRGQFTGRGAASHQVCAFVAQVFNASKSAPQKKTDVLLLDNCATHHMVNDKSLLTDSVPCDSKCYFADTLKSVPVKGIGSMILYNHEGRTQKLKNVQFVPTFTTNLISVSQADEHGAFHQGGNGVMSIYDAQGNTILRGVLKNGLYHAHCTAKQFHPTVAAASNVAPTATLVHRRSGHVGMSTLAKTASNDVVSNLPPAEQFMSALKAPSVCGACQEGTQKAQPYPRTPRSQKTLVPFAKRHVDIAGPRKASSGGARYFTVIVDEAPGFMWVGTHATKDHAGDFLIEKIADFVVHQGKSVRAVRCDRDTVFLSQKVVGKLRQFNVHLEPTSGYSPQENGHAELAIGVLKMRMQDLLSDSGLNDSWWAEAVWHACYLQNITSSTGSTTPWELIKHETPDAFALRIWGCKAWKLIPTANRSKSSDTRCSEQVRYLGIAWPNPKAFRVLTSRGCVERSRHLAF